MAVPVPLLHWAEQHACFTGCYSSDTEVRLCLDPTGPVQQSLVVTCEGCFAHIGTLASLAPPGSTIYWLAGALTQHIRQHRGFTLSFGGYHARGPGFWLSGVYLDRGVFLLNGDRSRSLGTDLEILRLAFQNGVVTAPDPRMDNPALYTTQDVYINFAGLAGPLAGKQGLLTSRFCRTQPTAGFQRVTLAEFQPLASAASAAAPPPAPSATAPTPPGPSPARATPTPSTAPAATAGAAPTSGAPAAAPRQATKPGEICPICHAEVRERWLLNSSYVGCLC